MSAHLARQGALTLLFAVAASTAGAQRVQPGAPAPEIDLATLAGGRVKLSALRGHPVVVSFWGTYCPPCRDEFPDLVRAYSSLSAAGLNVVGVNARDQELSTKAVQAFADEFSARFTIALDQRGRSRRDYLIFGLPTTIFIDSSGVIRNIHRGPMDRAALDSGLATIVPPRTGERQRLVDRTE